MSTTYTFDLTEVGGSKTLKIKVTKNLVLPNEWEDANPVDSCLVIGGGGVDDSNGDRIICHSGPPKKEAVMTILGFHWDKNPRARGGRSLRRM